MLPPHVYPFRKQQDVTCPRIGPKFNLHHLQEISAGFKMVMLIPESGIGISLITKF